MGQGDQALLAQLGEGAADGFHGQAEMVGDVATAHRQGHAQPRFAQQRFARGQAQQEIGDLLGRLQPAQRHRGILRGIQFLAGALQQLAFQVGEARAQVLHLRQGHAADPAVGDGLDVIAVVVAAAQAEEIAGQHEAADLAAPVGQRADQAQCAGRNRIDMLARLAGTGQGRSQRQRLRDGDPLQRLHFIRRQRRADRQVPYRAMQAVAQGRATGGGGVFNSGKRGTGVGPGHVRSASGACL